MLTLFQQKIVRTLISCRSENSYFAGSSVFNEMRSRLSGDLDIFHSSSQACEGAFIEDKTVLEHAGFSVQIVKQNQIPFFAKCLVCDAVNEVEIDWAFDSGYRFFPAQKHPKFGYVLHEYDLLVGKVLACAGRNAVRDYYDLCDAWSRGMPVVECVFAAPACDPGYSPTQLLDTMGFTSRYRPEDFSDLAFSKDLNEKELAELCVGCKKLFVNMVQRAREAFENLPFIDAGTLYLKKDTLKAFLPTQEELERGDFIRNTGRNFAPSIVMEDDDSEEDDFSPR